MKLRIATRKSRLALAQTRHVAAALKALEPTLEVEELPLTTEGDRILDRPLAEIGGKGLFVSEVEAAIVDGRADIAVHSIKDVPSGLAEGLQITAIPEREDPRDCLLSRDGVEIDALEAGQRIGTSSLRRAAQLKAHRPDLAFASLRGNVDTRLRKLDEGNYDAIVLALAGMKRLGLTDRKHWVIPTNVCLPAIGQGALGIETRAADAATNALVTQLDHDKTRLEVEAERALLQKLEGSCRVPIAGHAVLREGSRLTLHGMVGSLDGSRILSGASDTYLAQKAPEGLIAQAQATGIEVADNLIKQGALDLIREAIRFHRAARASGKRKRRRRQALRSLELVLSLKKSDRHRRSTLIYVRYEGNDSSQFVAKERIKRDLRGSMASSKATRLRVLLALSSGMGTTESATHVGCGTATVKRVKARYRGGGYDAVVADARTQGRPRKLSTREEKELVALACTSPPESRERWTIRLLAKHCGQDISVATVQRVLARDGIKPWREKKVVHRRDRRHVSRSPS